MNQPNPINPHAAAALKFGVVVMLPIAILFASVLNVLQYRTNITEIFAAKQYVYLSATVDHIERSLDFGKPLESLYGMDGILREQLDRHDSLRDIVILNEQHEVLYSAAPNSDFRGEDPLDTERFTREGNTLRYPMALPGNSLLVAVADTAEVDAHVRDYVRRLAGFGLALVAVSGTLLLGLFHRCVRSDRSTDLPKIKVVSLGILIVTQLVLGGFIGIHFLENYQASLQALAQEVATTVESELGRLTAAGIPFEELHGLDAYFADYARRIPDFSEIEFSDANVSDKELQATVTLAGSPTRTLKFALSDATVRDSLWQLLLNIVLLITASILLAVEAFMTVTARTQDPPTAIDVAKMRISVFGLYACVNMGMILVPLVAAQLYRPESGLSYGFTVASPMTVEMLAGLAAILFSAPLLEKLGFRRAFLVTVPCCSVGLLLSAAAGNLPTFLAGRAALGFGYGLITMLARTYASSQDSAEGRTAAMSAMTAGSIAGLAFGSVIGGILADQLAYRVVFVISAGGILLCPLLFPTFSREMSHKAPVRRGRLTGFLHWDLLRYLALLVVPIYACAVFVSYVTPIAGHEMGLLAAAISAVVLINSLLSAYLSPPLTHWVMKRLGTQKGVVLYAAVTAAAIAYFAWSGTAAALVAVAIVLSIADSFGIVVLMEGFQSLCDKRGQTPATGIMVFTIAGKAGQALAPMILAQGASGAIAASCIGLAIFAAGGLLLYRLFR